MSNPDNVNPVSFFGIGARQQSILPANVNTADPAGMSDTFLSRLSLDASGRLRVFLSGSPTLLFSPAIVANSVGAMASAAAPGIGAAVVTIVAGSLPAGTYDVQALVYFSVAGTKNNAEFRRGATVVSGLLVSVTANVVPPVRVFRCVLDGATAVSINATAADAVGTYEGQLIATRVA